MSALKMKFLQGKSGDKYNYPVTKSDGVFFDDQGKKTLKSFIDSDLKTLSWLPSKSIENKHLKNASVTRDNIGTGAISTTKIADEAVTNQKIKKYEANKPGSGIQTDRIADGAITDAKILAFNGDVGGISGDKIKDGAITLEKAAFGQIELIYSGVPVGTSGKANVTGLDKYRCLILGVTNGGPSTVGSDGNQNGGSMLATIMIPLIKESEGTFAYRPFTNVHQAFFPDIKEDGTGSYNTYSAWFQFDSNSTSSGKVWLAERAGASYSGLVLFGIK